MAPPEAVVPLGHASGQFHTVPVWVNDRALTVAVLDTGIGIELISQALCERVGCVVEGSFSGQRMSGQEVTLPLTRLERLEVAGVVREDVLAGVVDIEGFFSEPQLEVFVGLPFFEQTPFTLDGPGSRLVIESAASLSRREAGARAVPVSVRRHGPAIDLFVPLRLGDQVAEVMMDTGSRSIILHPRYAELLGIDLEADDVRRQVGEDETGNPFTRHFTTIEQPVAFEGAPGSARAGLAVMFQEIIHDGLVGTDLLSRCVVTYDLPRGRILVSGEDAGP
ncbi:hypothetical protein DB30_02246 [Enhygromyxa salina]|uniref:Aspartyl protease n=1 Tax=Enhygromyxa salina TaxID=215803 RepID=A0A0C2CQF2_9BACT|nr:pepsin/retropepsin-like aspartic protease family protein [Enhygromyxa salina]KIG11945.1 hypothetical protein DB30_02246 [Enhygromyxa salina]